jgi:8-oxo-dGTP pyrophosphatase MutT (NUDIX family)
MRRKNRDQPLEARSAIASLAISRLIEGLGPDAFLKGLGQIPFRYDQLPVGAPSIPTRILKIGGREVHSKSVELPCGGTDNFAIIRNTPGNIAVPLLLGSNGTLDTVLIKHFRGGAEGYYWEIPAGGLKDGETPEIAIKREVEQETLYKVVGLQRLGLRQESAPVFMIEERTPFVAFLNGEKVARVSTHDADREIVEIRQAPLHEAVRLVCGMPNIIDDSVEVVDEKTQAGLLHSYYRYNALQLELEKVLRAAA